MFDRCSSGKRFAASAATVASASESLVIAKACLNRRKLMKPASTDTWSSGFVLKSWRVCERIVVGVELGQQLAQLNRALITGFARRCRTARTKDGMEGPFRRISYSGRHGIMKIRIPNFIHERH